ncbi:hypothetical protein DID88_005784 [Monilinia fructigena]|uniref:Uncharacterized protein n=1 Tax=Monilinia fructigena TaxID=38457 RepID=A0A395J340_9HELO|nr:hypothetical protein DID88_005784 [Monilinia fructigena]
MWSLDRLSGHTTPSASPPPPLTRIPNLPRRPSHLLPSPAGGRPPFNPRSSSLSLVSNDSTTSLLSSSRRPNGSNLKQTAAPPNVPDPLEVLGKLLYNEEDLKSPSAKGQKATNGILPPIGQEDDESEWDFGGSSLQDIVAGEPFDEEDEHVYKSQTLEEYERDKYKFEDLHRSIRACDDVLNSVEINLTSFQNDLAMVSAEIETLQARSTALSVRGGDQCLPAVVKKIVDGAIDEAWVRALAEVEKRSKAMDAKSKEQRNIKGVNDLKPLLENLVSKALERIRDFLVAQLAEELGQAYMNTMRWYFLNQFTRYSKALEKIKLHVLDRHDVLGSDDGSRKATLLSASKPAGPPHDAFNLGRRIDLLKTSNQNALPSFLAEEDKQTHYMEFPFRNFNLALIDNASAEYSFLTSFFSPSLTYAAISRHFNYIFEPTFALGQSITKSLVHDSHDCLGLLLCVRLNQHFAFSLQRRKIPAVDPYINATSMLLWPRFQLTMDIHCDSVRTLTSALPTRKPSASEQARQSAAPHFMTQRFGQFLQGILELSTEAGDDEPVASSLARLRSEMEAFLTKCAGVIVDKRKKERFLFNNYSLIITIVGDAEGKLAGEQRVHFEELKKAFGDAV